MIIYVFIYIYKLYVLNSGILGYSVFRQTQGICQQRWGFKNDLTSHILTGCPEEKSQFVHSKNDSRSNWENDTILADGEGSQFSPLEVVVVFHCYSIAILICPRWVKRTPRVKEHRTNHVILVCPGFMKKHLNNFWYFPQANLETSKIYPLLSTLPVSLPQQLQGVAFLVRAASLKPEKAGLLCTRPLLTSIIPCCWPGGSVATPTFSQGLCKTQRPNQSRRLCRARGVPAAGPLVGHHGCMV